MTEKDKEIQELRRRVKQLERENARLQSQHMGDQAEIIRLRRQYECQIRRMEEGAV